MFQVSFYNNVNDNTGFTITIAEVIEIIAGRARASGKIEQVIEKLRELSAFIADSKIKLQTTEKGNAGFASFVDGFIKQYDELKQSLPAVTWSGTFKKRNAKLLEQYSYFICIDIDKLEPGEPFSRVRMQLREDPFTHILFVSPSGNGLKVVIKVPTGSDKHKETFITLEQYFKEKFQVDIDPSGKDVSRLCFLSYDKEIHVNQLSQTFTAKAKEIIIEPDIIKLSKISTKEKNTLRTSGQMVNDVWESTQTYFNYAEGNRNNFVFKFACNCNRVGISLTDCESFAISAANDLSAQTVENTAKSAYKSNIHEHGKYKKMVLVKTGPEINGSMANVSNIQVHEPKQNGILKAQSLEKANKQAKEEIIFFSPLFRNDDAGHQVLKDIRINYVKFTELIYSFGYRRYDIDKDFIYIQLQNNVIKEVTILQIQDYFFRYLEALPEEISNGVTKKSLKEKFYNNPKNYFCDNRLSLLNNNENILLNTDTKNEGFVYYRNGYVKCDQKTWELKPYNTLTGYIWHNQIINRDFKYLDIGSLPMKQLSVYAQFLFNVSGKDENRFNSLCSLIGYLLHSYTDVKMKAIILTDSRISEEANGRTGKTLFGQTLKHIKKLTQINGKDFDPTQRYKYQEANLDTQIIFLNDVRSNLKFEVLYNDITEGITVEKKNQTPFTLKTKMCITTNKTIAIEGSSSKDRCIEFEFANHYSEKYSPEDEFKQRFFSDWDQAAWEQFDNFMMNCICVYLEHRVIEPENINLSQRKLLDQTHPYFIEFMNEKIANGTLIAGTEVWKQEFHNLFLSEYQELVHDKYKGKLETFTKWIRIFAKYSPNFNDDTNERKSGDKRFFTLSSNV